MSSLVKIFLFPWLFSWCLCALVAAFLRFSVGGAVAVNTSYHRIRPLCEGDIAWATALVRERWRAEIVVVHGQVYRPAELLGFVAEQDGEPVGLITVHFEGDTCEVVTLDSLREGCGVGTALLDAAKEHASRNGCRRLWLVTTNDNLHALRFYQRYGFKLVALRPGAVEESRKIKPSIPLLGNDDIPIRDELDLVLTVVPEKKSLTTKAQRHQETSGGEGTKKTLYI
jgi:ribosomal protein S18 acetylase RimI-like enzyme